MVTGWRQSDDATGFHIRRFGNWSSPVPAPWDRARKRHWWWNRQSRLPATLMEGCHGPGKHTSYRYDGDRIDGKTLTELEPGPIGFTKSDTIVGGKETLKPLCPRSHQSLQQRYRCLYDERWQWWAARYWAEKAGIKHYQSKVMPQDKEDRQKITAGRQTYAWSATASTTHKLWLPQIVVSPWVKELT